jgi:hypothetical protein
MLHKKDIELKLAEYRVRHTGKDPFGPWSDLKRLHESLDPDGQAVLAQVLKEKKKTLFGGTSLTCSKGIPAPGSQRYPGSSLQIPTLVACNHGMK